MMDNREKLIMDNMQTIKSITWFTMKKIGLPKSEYEDYLQEAYLLILKKADKYNPEKKFSTFAEIVLKNGFIDLRRRDSQENLDLISLDEPLAEDEEEITIMDFLKGSYDTENEALQNVTIEQIKHCISQAKKNCTAKTTLRGFDALELRIKGYSGAQIAEMFKVPANSVRCWMSRATKLLDADGRLAALLCSKM